MARRVTPDYSFLPVGYLSASAVNLFLICPQAYKLKYIDKVSDTSVPVSIIEGKAMHKAMEENNHHKLRSGDDFEPKQLIEVFGDTWSDTSKAITDWDEDNPDKVFARGSTQLRTYLKRYAGKFCAVDEDAIETKVEGSIGGVPTLGYIDLISHPLKAGEKPRIVDYKCVKRARSKGMLEADIQMGVYPALTGLREVEYLCFVKTKEPKIQRVAATRTEESVRKVENVFRGVAEAIRKGSFPYCDPTSWKCCKKYCGVWHACKQGGKR